METQIEIRYRSQRGVGVIELPAFGTASLAYDGAEIVDEQGGLYVSFAEPERRVEGIDWTEADEQDWRRAVRAVALAEIGPDSQAPQDRDYYLVLDPGRDQTEEAQLYHRHLCRACGRVTATIDVAQSECESDASHDYALCAACAR